MRRLATGVRFQIVRDHAATVDAAEFRLDEDQPQSGTVVLAVHGDVDLHTAAELGRRLVAAIDRGVSVLVVDLSAVAFVDSQGLGALLHGARRFGPGERRLRLVVPGREIRRVFELTSLDQVLPLHRTREEALASAGAEQR